MRALMLTALAFLMALVLSRSIDLGSSSPPAPENFESNDALASRELTTFERFQEDTCLQDGRVTFVTTKDGNSEVYVANSDGSGLINLSNQLTNDLSPVWSSDCRWIAYSSDRKFYPSAGFEIFIAAADGSGESPLLPPDDEQCCQDYAEAWSPDGMLILFARGNDLYVVKPDGTDLRWIAFGNAPHWSSDSQTLTYRHPIGNSPRDLYEVHVDGSNRKLLQAGVAPPQDCFQDVLSPDGTKRACMSTRIDWNQEIFVIDVATGSVVNVSDSLIGADTDPAWSPDSMRMAFASNRNGAFEIFVVDAHGTGLVQVTRADPGSCCGDQNPARSADGTLITFVTQRGGVEVRCEVRPDGGNATC